MSPTRRSVLLGGLPLLAACTRSQPRATSSASPALDPDDALRTAARLRELALVEAYGTRTDAAARAAVADHRAHLVALGDSGVSSPAPARATSTRVLEASTARAHAAAALTASPALAQVLASLAACEASHAVLS